MFESAAINDGLENTLYISMLINSPPPTQTLRQLVDRKLISHCICKRLTPNNDKYSLFFRPLSYDGNLLCDRTMFFIFEVWGKTDNLKMCPQTRGNYMVMRLFFELIQTAITNV